jgi:PAS domain S-box-containing protein
MGSTKNLDEAKFRSIIEKASDAIIISDEKGIIVEWNDSAEKVLELKRSDAIGQTIWDIQYQLAPDEKKSDQLYEKTKAMITDVLVTGRFINKYEQPIDKEIQCYDGTCKIVQSSTFAVPSENGFIIVGILRDVTKQKKMEEELREYKDQLEKMLNYRTSELDNSEELFRSFVEMSSDGITIMDREGRIVEWNRALEDISGLKNEDALGKYIWDVQYSLLTKEKKNPDIYNKIKSISKQLLDDSYPAIASPIMESELLNSNGEVKIIQTKAFPIDNENGHTIGSIIRDVTEQKRIEQALKEERDKLETITENMGVSMAVISRDYRTIWANGVLKRMFGEDIEGKICYETYRNLDSICSECGIKKVFEKNSDSYVYEYSSKNPDGSVSWFQTIVNTIRDKDGQINSALELIIPITDLKMAQEALRKSEEEYRTLFELTLDPIIIFNPKGSISQINQAGVNMFGYDNPGELIGKYIIDMFFDKSKVEIYRDQIGKDGYLKNIELELIKKDGSVIYVLTSTKVIYNDHGEKIRYEGFYKDITEKRRIEEELMKAQKLESIGLFAGGIAHDLNNILTPILGNILLSRIQKDHEKIAERLLEAEKATLMARDLTQQLLTFSKGGAPIRRPTSISDILKDSLSFALRGTNVRSKLSIPNDLWVVDIDEGQISQVITNIILNADQAMPNGGTIEVKAENIFINEEKNLPLKSGEYIRISIKDQGIGISEEFLQKIFDPYWTTKKIGSGLGLTTSYSIIKNHEGYIDVESQLKAGTTFYIYLPALSEMVLAKREEQIYEPIMGKGNILVMDDDEMIRELATKMLESMGYSMTLACDGGEALRLYQEAMELGHPYDAVVLDLSVPGSAMGGKDAMRLLLRADPYVRAIVSSGYSNDPIMSEFKKYGFKAVIAKPYKVREFSEVLAKVLMDDE